MFTGIVEEIGWIRGREPAAGGVRLAIGGRRVLEELAVDGSVAVDGVCLTAVKVDPGGFEAVAVEETLRKTTLGVLAIGDPVNLERSLKLGARLDGHLVQGHVDGVATVVGRREEGADRLLTVEVSPELEPYLVARGSIALAGVSLTIARLSGRRLTVALIPHTCAVTTLGHLGVGDRVNVEADMLAKHLEALLQKHLSRVGAAEPLHSEPG
ncbi:MAG TPA: riboflavin synthase [Acidobacteriota bacterium]